MPRRYYYRHHYHGYRRAPANPICSLIYCAVLAGFFIFIFWNTTGFYAFGYFTPFIGIMIFVAISGIIAAIINAARRKSRLQAQPAGVTSAPPGYPQPGMAGGQPVQPAAFTASSMQPVPPPRPVGYPQPQVPYPGPAATTAPPTRAMPARFCSYCGTTVESNDQRFCANCGASL